MGYRDDEGMRVTSRDDFGSSLRRFLTVLALLALIGWGTLFFVVRTDGGQSFVRDRLVSRLRLEADVARVRLVPPLSLVLEEVATADWKTAGTPGFRAAEVRYTPGWRTRIGVRGLECRLVRDAEGVWLPAAFSRLGDVPIRSVAALSGLTAADRDRCVWRVRDAAFDWLDEAGRRMAWGAGVDFDLEPVGLPGRRAWYYSLAAYEGQAPDGSRFRDCAAEWLSTGARAYIEVSRRTGRAAAGAAAFWTPGEADAAAPADDGGEEENTDAGTR
jgi:hypothetical protein